jgi:hypothetical protein
MKLVQNRGADRAIDLLRPHLKTCQTLAFMTPTFSLHAYAELRDALARLDGTQLILPAEGQDLELQGGDLFRGQEICRTEFTVTMKLPDQQLTLGVADTDKGLGNRLTLVDDQLLDNLRSVQLRS